MQLKEDCKGNNHKKCEVSRFHNNLSGKDPEVISPFCIFGPIAITNNSSDPTCPATKESTYMLKTVMATLYVN